MTFEYRPEIITANQSFNRKETILPFSLLHSTMINQDLPFSTIPAGNNSFFKFS